MTAESTPAIACDMSGAPDTPDERLAEYGRLFDAALVARARTAAGVRWRFRAGPGVEARARDLATREEACCAFTSHTITRVGDEVWWDAAAVDDPAAQAVLDLFFDLPDHRGDEAGDVHRRWAETTGTPVAVTSRPRTPTSTTAGTAPA